MPHHDLSDVNSERLHMTVVKGFRRNSPIPNILQLHFEDIPPEDIQFMFGVRVTSPMRTLLDIIGDKTVSKTIQKQAVHEALKRGLITRREFNISSSKPS